MHCRGKSRARVYPDPVEFLTLGIYLQDMGWDLSEWLPLVQDRRFLPWLVKVPSEQQQVKSHQV